MGQILGEGCDGDDSPGVGSNGGRQMEEDITPASGPDVATPPHGRPSRQSLIVEQTPSPVSLMVGAALCAGLGFSLVLCLGIGRSARPPAETSAVAEQASSPERPTESPPPGAPSEPGLLASGADDNDTPPGGADPWRARRSAPPVSGAAPPREVTSSRLDPAALPVWESPPQSDRYATRMASLEAPPRLLPSAGDERALSRFSAGPARDAGMQLAALEPAAEPVGGDAAAVAPHLEPLPVSRQQSPDAPPAALDAPPAALETPPAAPDSPPSPQRGDGREPADTADLVPSAAPDLAGPASLPARFPKPAAPAALGPQPFIEAPVQPAPAPPVAPTVPPSRRPAAPAPAATPAARSGGGFSPPATATFPPHPVASASAALPFAAAPPLAGPTPATGPAAGPVGGSSASRSAQGKPGPMQLEGLQSPQLALEKRGPREVQVGKAARYEILVRNSGSAVAYDVVLRDAVPQGTTLVTTTPPASPADGPDDLLWPIGVLEAGGQARVVMEVMPQVEGEIGSVASVSFRTDASVRSRATKPDLVLEVSEPRAVLIGRDLQFTIRVANPGTGVATGVVLEGFLPENVSHRSGRELEFDVGQLRPGESRSIDVVLGTRGPGVHAARFAARADGGLAVDRQVRLEVTAPTLELAIDMPTRRFLQRPATCTLAVVNAGTAEAKGIELVAQLPPGLKFVRANNAGWHDDRTNRVLWSLEELPAGETGTVELVVMPVEFGPQKIAAAARTADGLSHQAMHVCEVEGLAALSFQVLDSEDPIEVGGLTEYVVRVTNQGTRPATGVRLSAALLGDLEPIAAEGPVGHRLENLVVVFEPLAKLAPAEEAVFRIRVRGRRAGDQRVQVQLVSADHQTAITKEEVTRVYDDR